MTVFCSFLWLAAASQWLQAEKSLIAVHFQRCGFARSGVSCLDLNGTAAAADAVNVIALVAGTAIISSGRFD